MLNKLRAQTSVLGFCCYSCVERVKSYRLIWWHLHLAVGLGVNSWRVAVSKD